MAVADRLDRLVRQAHLQLGPVVCDGRLELGDDGAREFREIDLLGAQVERSRVDPRKVEQVDRQLLKPLHLLGHRRQKLLTRLLVELLVLEQLDEPTEREDRRAQLVRGVCDELAARVVHARQLLLHLVEGVRQAPELVTRLDRQRLHAAPRRQVARRALEPAHALGQPLRHEPAAH